MIQLPLVPQTCKDRSSSTVITSNSPLCRYQRIMENLETVDSEAEEEVLLARANVLFHKLSVAERLRVKS
jgi:hypothetical protein